MPELKAQHVPWSALTKEGHLSRLLLLCFGVWLYAADSRFLFGNGGSAAGGV